MHGCHPKPEICNGSPPIVPCSPEVGQADPEEFFAGAFGIFTGEESYQVEIRIDDNYAPYVTERFGHESQKLVPEDEGGLVLRMELGRLEEVTDWILGMGEHVEVLAPEELRERVQERLEGALSIYRNRAAT